MGGRRTIANPTPVKEYENYMGGSRNKTNNRLFNKRLSLPEKRNQSNKSLPRIESKSGTIQYDYLAE